jgi:flagellar basal-body rod protein FlgC
MADFSQILKISAAGMSAQTLRLRTIAENIANADSLAETPGGAPYRRKMVTFKNVMDRELGANKVKIDKITTDKSQFQKRFDPQHPAADRDGYVQTPNVNGLVEVMDMRQAQRSYEANLGVVDIAKSMASRTIDILRG